MTYNILRFPSIRIGGVGGWQSFLTVVDVYAGRRPRCTESLPLPTHAGTAERCVPQTMADHCKQIRLKPPTVGNPRLLKVAVLGEPNAGKSTLTNALMRWQVCSISKKVHTTRQNTAAVLMEGSTQIVFVDTPGLVSFSHGKRHDLEASLVMDPENSLQQADTILVVVDAENKRMRTRIDQRLLNLLRTHGDKDTVLVLNKVDLVKKKGELLDVTRNLTNGIVGDCAPLDADAAPTAEARVNLETLFRGMEAKQHAKKDRRQTRAAESEKSWTRFSEIFMVSALDGDGVDQIRDYLVSRAKPQPWLYHHSVVTDQNPHEVAVMAVRGRLLDHLPQEIPYSLKLVVEMWNVEPSGLLRIVISIVCSRNGHLRLVLGRKGETVAQIVEEARQVIANTFRCDVVLKLLVKDVKTSPLYK